MLTHACIWHGWVEQSQNGKELVTERLARSISSFHHTNDHRQYCHVGNTAQHCRLGVFRDSDLLDILKIVNLPRVSLVYLWKSNICSRKWNVPVESCVSSELEHSFPLFFATNVSVSQFHGIGSKFSECWFANGWNPCSRSMGCGDRSRYVPKIESKVTHPYEIQHSEK